MGLAPQVVDEIFGSSANLNTRRRSSFLLAEQNTQHRCEVSAHVYGYILEARAGG